MTTPEGKIKRKVSNFLKGLGPDCYYFMPVQMGYGSAALDYMGAWRGKAWAIETKAFGRKPTPLQHFTIQRMEDAGMAVFVVSNDAEMLNMQQWFTQGGNNGEETKSEGHQGRSSRDASVRARRTEGRQETQGVDEEGQEKGQERALSGVDVGPRTVGLTGRKE
jgi:hypothetical protein